MTLLNPSDLTVDDFEDEIGRLAEGIVEPERPCRCGTTNRYSHDVDCPAWGDGYA